MISLSDAVGSGGERQEVCEIHGPYTSKHLMMRIWTKCPECEKEKALERKKQEEESERLKRLANWQKKLGSSGIPSRFIDRTLDSYRAENEGQKTALAFAKDYANNFSGVLKTGRSAIFIGRPGTGKTHLACGIALQVMAEYQCTALFLTVQRAIRRIKDTWARGASENESDAIDSMIEPDLLILDEVGVQFGSKFEENVLFDILNGRYENRRPTILMSNLQKEAVFEYLGERVIDRIREDGGRVVPFSWGSNRNKARGLD